MKKIAYYIAPFVIFTILFLLPTLLDSTEILEFIVFASLFLFAAVLGIISPSKAWFDYLITIIVPVSVFFALFISLFFDEGCDGTPQLSLNHALNIEYYQSWLPIALVMTVIAFVFSFEPVSRFIKSKVCCKKSEK